MNLQSLEIVSDRLKLVPISRKYLKDIFANFTSEITTYMFPAPPKRKEETEEFIDSAIRKNESGEDIVKVITNKETGEFLGCGGLHKIKSGRPELEIWIKKSAHGNHYGREALTALKDWADQNINYQYIKYPVDKKNIPSRKIAESLGGEVIAEMQKTNLSGNILDEVEYRIYKK
ncbi:GNAT family N-acetyltransferase [Candidatus Daviesbacteria bacterium]|nr:GNAT family N-acetyltransferase [Candidatus Daviesbacteria bacterium]